jgi:hypothetical protein
VWWGRESPAVAEPIAKEVVEFRDLVDLLDGVVKRIGNTTEPD